MDAIGVGFDAEQEIGDAEVPLLTLAKALLAAVGAAAGMTKATTCPLSVILRSSPAFTRSR